MHTLDSIFDVDNLRKVWAIIKEGLRDDLVRDPLDHLAYEVNLEQNLKQLRHFVLSGSYVPKRAKIIRGAKRSGLTRPLSFLEIEDLLVLKCICDSLQTDLHKDFPDYVDFSRRLRTAFPKEQADYESWFGHWLRHQNKLTRLAVTGNGWQFVVEADISNFFPSVNHLLLRQTITSRVNAEERVTNLLFYLLEAMLPRPQYSCDHREGLPQESHDASRILAHCFLHPVDLEFKHEGLEGRYARWVDDIVVGVFSEAQGKRVLSKLEKALESRGLFVNTSKCKISSRKDIVKDLYLEENKFLDEIHEETKKDEGKVDVDEFDGRLLSFLKADRYGNWDRVLRRYYTESKRCRSSFLEDLAFKHLTDFPSEAGDILSYLEARPYREDLLEQAFSFLRGEENCYPDVEILVYEFLLRWGMENGNNGRHYAWKNALDHFFGRNGFCNPQSGYVRGLITLVCYKFGGQMPLKEIVSSYRGDNDIDFISYAFCCLAGTDDFREEAFEKAAVVENMSIRRLEKLINDLEKNSISYEGLLRKMLTPNMKKYPTRFMLGARALPIVRISRRDKAFKRQFWQEIIEDTLTKLKKTEEELEDKITIDFLTRELEKP